MSEFLIQIIGDGDLSGEAGQALRIAYDMDAMDRQVDAYRIDISTQIKRFDDAFFHAFIGPTLGVFIEQLDADETPFGKEDGTKYLLRRFHLNSLKQDDAETSADRTSDFLHILTRVVRGVANGYWTLKNQTKRQERRGEPRSDDVITTQIRRNLKQITRLDTHAL